MRALEHAATFDQVNVPELACMELLLRRAQLSELRHKERILSLDPADDFGDDSYLYMGTGVTRGQLMIDPDLEDFVRKQMETEGGIMKERRKLQEERHWNKQRRGAGRDGKGKGKGKDDKNSGPAGVVPT